MTAKHQQESNIFLVPVPLSVARAIGCRPDATVRLHLVGNEIRVVPDTIRTEVPITKVPTPNATNMWESCHSWWRGRGGN